jgi:hypothetical protein
MNQKLYSTLLIFVFSLISCKSIYAQNGLEGRNNIKASYSLNRNYGFQSSYFFQVEYNQGITRFLEIGSYFSLYEDAYPVLFSRPVPYRPIIGFSPSSSYQYGLQSNFHPLQLLLKDGHRFRFDLYLHAKLGGRYFPIPESYYRPKEHFFEYNFGVGLAYHLFKHWGIYAEYNYRLPANFRYGLSIKF